MPASCARADRTSRVTAIDGLRGLLAVVVLAWHVSPDRQPWLLILADIGVAMFFVLSGAVLARGWDGNLAVFLVRRVVRLWAVYAVCLSLGYLVAGVPPVWSEFLWYPLINVDTQPPINPGRGGVVVVERRTAKHPGVPSHRTAPSRKPRLIPAAAMPWPRSASPTAR